MEPKSVKQLYNDSKKITEEENDSYVIRLLRQWNDESIEKCKFRMSKDNVRVNNTDIEEARLTDTMYNNKLIHEQGEKIMHKVYDNIKSTLTHTRLMRSLEEARRRYILARVSPKQRFGSIVQWAPKVYPFFPKIEHF